MAWLVRDRVLQPSDVARAALESVGVGAKGHTDWIDRAKLPTAIAIIAAATTPTHHLMSIEVEVWRKLRLLT